MSQCTVSIHFDIIDYVIDHAIVRSKAVSNKDATMTTTSTICIQRCKLVRILRLQLVLACEKFSLVIHQFDLRGSST